MRWSLKSPASRLFTQLFIQARIKENIKAPRHWLLCEKFTGEFPAQRAGNAENVSIWWCHHATHRFSRTGLPSPLCAHYACKPRWGSLESSVSENGHWVITPGMIKELNNAIVVLMMTSSNGNISRVAGLLCGEFTGHRWIALTKASDAKLWCFLWSAPEQTVE